MSMHVRWGAFTKSAFLLLAAIACAADAVADSGACETFGPWSPPVNLGSVVNSPYNDFHPAISPDGMSLYITSDRPGGSGLEDIWVSRRSGVDAPWGVPVPLGPSINTADSEYAPNISADGHWLLFSRASRPFGTVGPSQIYVSHRDDVTDDFGWEPAQALGGGINAPSFDANAPRIFVDGQTGIVSIFFNSILRSGGLGDYDEYVSRRGVPGDLNLYHLKFPEGDDVTALNSPYRDTPTGIRSDGLAMFVTSNRDGFQGQTDSPPKPRNLDLWVSMRPSSLDDDWRPSVNLNADALNENGESCSEAPTSACINTAFNEGAPALSLDGTALYFYSDRPGGYGRRDLYVAARSPSCGGE